MKITKLPHACLIIENNASRIVIDPSSFFVFGQDFATPQNVVAVVFTHNHSDHYDPQNLAKLMEKNPDMQIFASADTAASIAQDLPDISRKVEIAKPSAKISTENFALEFFGGRHAHIVPGDDKGDNVGVVVNRALVYPGDSFDLPPSESLDDNFALALPTSGPWLKIGEAMTYLADFAKKAAPPTVVFATHDGLNNSGSAAMTLNYLRPICDELNAKLVDLQVGQKLEI